MDKLTGLMTRTELNKVAHNRMLYGVQVNVRRMQSINDCCGHEMGDALIKMHGEILSDMFNWNNVFRYGGDSFVILTEYDNFKNVLDSIFMTIDLDVAITVYSRKNKILDTFEEKTKAYKGPKNMGSLYIEKVAQRGDFG